MSHCTDACAIAGTGGLITLVFGVLAVILAGNEILSYIYM